MRALVQRVLSAEVTVDEKTVSSIDQGYLIYLGVGKGDETRDIEYLVKKISELRIINDDQGKMNLAVTQSPSEILVVSQFTLYGDTSRGRRPSFNEAASPDKAAKMCESFSERLASCTALPVRQGIFGAHMLVTSVNDGPINFIVESKK